LRPSSALPRAPAWGQLDGAKSRAANLCGARFIWQGAKLGRINPQFARATLVLDRLTRSFAELMMDAAVDHGPIPRKRTMEAAGRMTWAKQSTLSGIRWRLRKFK